MRERMGSGGSDRLVSTSDHRLTAVAPRAQRLAAYQTQGWRAALVAVRVWAREPRHVIDELAVVVRQSDQPPDPSRVTQNQLL